MNGFKKHLIAENDRLKQEILLLQSKINELHERIGYVDGYADGFLASDIEIDVEDCKTCEYTDLECNE